ncbi:MAG: hypothetical protein ACYC6M_16440, partial [Terriglobales bacterium]
MRSKRASGRSNERRGVILMVVLALLTLFAVVGIAFVLYAQSEATSARIARDSETAQHADMDPEQALALFLGQFIYDVPDSATGVGSGVRGHSLARTMYGYKTPGINNIPFNGVGRLHYRATPPVLAGADDYTLVNYTWFSGDGFLRDPEHYGARAGLGAAQGPYVGGNAPYTYPDLNNFYLAAVKADGTVLTPSFHRKWLFNPNNAFNDMSNLNWTNPQGKYLTLRPRPNEHPKFPAPDDATGDVKNLVGGPGGNDSIWIDIGAPVMTAPDGTKYKMLVAPLIMDLDNRINLSTAGNIVGLGATPNAPHRSHQGWGPWEVNLFKLLVPASANPQEPNYLFVGNGSVYGRYGKDGQPSNSGAYAPAGSPAHNYAQGDINASTDPPGPPAAGNYSSRIAPPGWGSPNPYSSWPVFAAGYGNGGIELLNNPLRYNVFRPATYFPGNDDRVFRASDMEPLLRPNSLGMRPVDTGSSALNSDLLRLCPSTFGPNTLGPRRRNMLTTLSMDLGAPGLSPWWYSMPLGTNVYSSAANPMQAPIGNAIPSPTLPPTPVTATQPSEFTPGWRAIDAALGRINLNRPLPPYPHMGSGVLPPWGPALVPYGVSYSSLPAAQQQFLVAQNARQQLANSIYRTLVAVTGAPLPATPAAPTVLDPALTARRWLAQLAVNI